MRSYDSEDAIIKDLLETNIRQRGNIGGSSVKLGRRIRELERIYGIREGSHGEKRLSNGQSKFTEEELANKLGIDINTLYRAKSLTTLPPEIQELIEQGNISPSTASRLIAKLTPEQQEQLIQSLPVTEKLTQKQVQSYVDQLSKKQESVDLLKQKYIELQEQLKQANNEARKDFSKSERMEYALRLARIDELKRIYGIRNGSINPKGTEIGTSVGLSNSREQSKTFDQILADEGIDRATYFKAKKLQSLSPEIQQLIEEDKISATTAYKLIAKLSDIEQEQLIQSLPITEKLTQKQVQGYVNQLKTKQDSVDLLKQKYIELQEQLNQRKRSKKRFL